MAKTSKSKPNLKKLQRPSNKRAKTEVSSPNGAVSVVQLPVQLEDDVADFPRGGGSSLSREEKIEARVLLEEDDNETGLRVLKKRKKEKQVRNRNESIEDDLGSLFGDGITGKFPRVANKITLKNVSSGMKLWGVIAEVNKKDITVSLPGGLRGLVRACDAFDPMLNDEMTMDGENGGLLSRIYHEGQLVSCTVLEVDEDKKEITRRKIWLSLKLSLLHKNLSLDTIQEGMVLSAYVKSIEDHGFILHFGLPSFAGFMPKDNQSENGNIKVSINHILQGVVKRVDRDRTVIHLNSEPDMMSKLVTKELKGIYIDLLFPGLLVNARVESILQNGIIFTFLTYFTGTVDIFNLDKKFPSSNWRNDYTKNMKFNARILFIDPSTRAVGLTLNPHLVSNKVPSPLVKIGDISQAKVIRVDKGSGIHLELPSLPSPTPAYVNVADVADSNIGKLDKNFKEQSLVRARVLGYRHLEGLATCTLKTSAVEGLVFTHADVKPGMKVNAKVIAVDSFGAIIQFASGVKALCPLRHMSELDIAKPRKKFQVGAELAFRVLGCKSKRITVTHKKTLVKSKLPIISSYADAVDGLITHGWITKIEKHGCFVRFYNGVQGFAPRSELRLGTSGDVSSSYHVEQAVKCRVVKCIPASHKINLSFIVTPPRASKDENVKPGSVVSGVVEHITPQDMIVNIVGPSDIKGILSREHLADHHGLAALFMSAMKPGYHFNELLVLDIEGNNVVLTAKHSLINSTKLPVNIGQISINSIVPGYICNIIETGCFVRYIGRLTGFAPKSKAADDRRLDLSEIFYVGQSVRSNIIDIDTDMDRITLSLKQSLCCSTDASFIQEYFCSEEKIAKLQVLNSEGSGLGWIDELSVGSIVEGKVHEIKDYGVVISFDKYKDVYGFISQFQLAGTTLESNSVIQAAVLDVSKIECLVDLSLKAEFINKGKEDVSNSKALKKKRKRENNKGFEVNQTVNAIVEIVKETYLVLSLPSYGHSIGYASLSDYNSQKVLSKQFTHGQCVSATIMALPAAATGGRLFLLLKSLIHGVDTSTSKRVKRKPNYEVGSLVQAEITEIKPLELRVKLGSGLIGRIHITEVTDDNSSKTPFSEYRIGQTLSARIICKDTKSESIKRAYVYELSIKPSLLGGSCDMNELTSEKFNYSYGQHVSGFVYKTDHDWSWLTLSPDLRAQLFILDSSSEPSELAEFQSRFYVGKALSGYVTSVNKEKKLLRIAMYKPFDRSRELNENDSDQQLLCHIAEGSIVGGRISRILPSVGGLLVQIDHQHFGKVHYTELTNWLPNPLAGYRVGQFVKCKVLEINRAIEGTIHVDLSMRSTQRASNSPSSTDINDFMHTSTQLVDKITYLHPNMVVQGYVKNVSPKGCFIMLSRKIDAKILLSNLSDTFVDNPEKEFPVGKLVTGRVLSVESLSKRIEVTLQTSNSISTSKLGTQSLSNIITGDVVHGRIKRVTPYGLFISIDQMNVVGLCHVSELSDDHLGDLEMKFKVGEKVITKILKVDKERNRVSLGMKQSYFSHEEIIQSSSTQNHVLVLGTNDSEPTVIPLSNSSCVGNMNTESDNALLPLLADVDSRAFVPPLDVPLDDIDGNDIHDNIDHSVENDTTTRNTTEENSKKSAKKKAREEREREISAAEDNLLKKGFPRSSDEFEKLVRASPNSSFIWIKYMAFMLSLADIEKARSIAERALRTINIREESEKLNIWVAYFNLENEYGNPPEEAVMKIFQRALQYCDPKKVHFALLGMYERTEQHKLANELLDKMCRKFKQSCKVWLRKIRPLLNGNSDGVQTIVNRALLCLPQHKHIKFISQTAILEFKYGVPDRGRSMFEGMLREYPKRTDLWSVYLDHEIRLGCVDLIRALFERAISLSLSPRKMKFLFKKYLEYEKSRGDEERIKLVMNKAMAYADNTLA